MNRLIRLLIFIILNICISAATTFAILWYWDRTHPQQLPAMATQSPQTITPTLQTPTASPVDIPPLEKTVIQIQNVFGAGELQTEVVELKRVGEGNLKLTNWKIKEEDGSEFIFPELTMNKDGTLQVFSRSGTNSPMALYWGLKNPTWRIGETVRLFDSAGNERANYQIR